MNIRHLPHLNDRDAWISFCQREQPYCFIASPEALVDFQTTYLLITLLEGKTRNGKAALKYSIGSRTTMEPAWRFIKACDFNLQMMLDGLNQVDFNGNVRDNSLLKAHTDLTVRKFFSKDKNIVSPSHMGLLSPLQRLPDVWNIAGVCRLLANQQFSHLDNLQLALPGKNGPSAGGSVISPKTLLLDLLDAPHEWQVRPVSHINTPFHLRIYQKGQPHFSLRPDLKQPEPKMRQRASHWHNLDG